MSFDIVESFQWLWNHIWAALKQMGGVAILTIIITFIVHRFNTRFEKKIEHKYDAKIEDLKVELDNQREHYKSLLEKRNYVSKTRFDTEFTICKELMIACKRMIDSIYFLFPNRNAEEVFECKPKWTKRDQDYWLEAAKETKMFGELEVYDRFKEIHEQCRMNILIYMYRNENDPINEDVTQEERKKKIDEGYKRTWQINYQMSAIADMLRQHFQDMDIQE